MWGGNIACEESFVSKKTARDKIICEQKKIAGDEQ